MSDFPFEKPEEIEVETESAPEIPQASVEEKLSDEPKEKKAKKTIERKATREIEAEDIKYVLANVREKSYLEMAEKLDLTKFQVNRILMDIKKNLRENAKGDPTKEAKVENYIDNHLSRTNVTRGGGTKGGKVREALDNVIEDILAGL